MPHCTHAYIIYWLNVHTDSYEGNIQTHKKLQISLRNFREFREWRVIWLKRTKLQEMRIIDPPL